MYSRTLLECHALSSTNIGVKAGLAEIEFIYVWVYFYLLMY
jgi:hypothetical protein